MRKCTDANRSRRLLLLLVCVGFFTACEKDIDIEIPTQKKLVILSNFSPDSLFKLRLAATEGLNNNEPLYPETAHIQLFEEGKFIQNFTYQRDPDEAISYYAIHHNPAPGKTYRIVANVEGFPAAEAQDSIPPKLDINSFEVIDLYKADISRRLVEYEIDATLSLPPPTTRQDYFHIRAWRKIIMYQVNNQDTIRDSYLEDISFSLQAGIQNLQIFHEPGTLLNRDALPNPTEIEMGFFVSLDPTIELKGRIYIELRRVSEAYYLFHKSVGEQEATARNNTIFSIPSTIIYNNIQNGLGNFSGYNVNMSSLAW